jgi:hypothetical protein
LQKSVPIQPKTSNILPKCCQKLATTLRTEPRPGCRPPIESGDPRRSARGRRRFEQLNPRSSVRDTSDVHYIAWLQMQTFRRCLPNCLELINLEYPYTKSTNFHICELFSKSFQHTSELHMWPGNYALRFFVFLLYKYRIVIEIL